MKYYWIIITSLLLCPPSYAEIFSIDKVVKSSCEEIASRGNQYGEFGSKSRGLSLGTTAANVILSLQELLKIEYGKINYSNNRSIYTICKYALEEINKSRKKLLDSGVMRSDAEKYIDEEIQFIRLLNSEIKRVHENNGLIVFVALDEPK